MTAVADTGSRAAGGSAVADTLVVTWRNLKRIPRIPELAAFAILQSVMFVLLFAYVFGGAIAVEGGSYREYLMPGIFAQTLAFASATTTESENADEAGRPGAATAVTRPSRRQRARRRARLRSARPRAR